MKTHVQLVTTAAPLASPSSHGSGRSAKLPVTSSRLSNTMMISPTGKIRAPTRGCPVETAPVKCEASGDAEDGAGELTADDEIVRRQRELAPAGFDHGRCDLRGLNVIHWYGPP